MIGETSAAPARKQNENTMARAAVVAQSLEANVPSSFRYRSLPDCATTLPVRDIETPFWPAMARAPLMKMIPISFTASVTSWMAFNAKCNFKQAVLPSTRQRTHAELVEYESESFVQEELAVLQPGLLRIPRADTD